MKTPGERFHDIFLRKYPRSQWPSFIDEIAIDINDRISISHTDLDSQNFPREAGQYYADGMIAAAGPHGDIKQILKRTISTKGLGAVVYQLNRLQYEIEQADTGLENVPEAIEAVLEKLLTKETGVDFTAQSHHHMGTTADVVMELFSDDVVAEHAETIVAAFEASIHDGLLARLDEPQMMTPLWPHQLEALEEWQDCDYQGYADMATATGKTVLGLAAIALRYGHLHPIDDLEGQKESSGRDKVLIVAHSDLILEQWRREFDRHLNIPKERTRGADDIELTWGTIHFRTPQHLLNQSHYPYDLVILDEAHHYAAGRNWRRLLDEFTGDILALSGSVDDAGTDSQALQERLRQHVGPEIKRYTIADAQRDGVIPAFDWEVRYAPFERDDQFVELTNQVVEDFASFRERLGTGDIVIDTERRLHTFDDIRTFANTTQGKELKQTDDAFRALATGLFSRRTKRWHLGPSLDAIAEVVLDHQTDHVLVLVDTNAQVEALVNQLEDCVTMTSVQAATSDSSRQDLRDQLDDFNAAAEGGVLVGTGDLLGEGVDIPEANVAVNMATGGVNAQLVQRIGRVLRNPSGNKHAYFYNVVGLPDTDAAVAAEDGRRLIEDAAEFCTLGGRFNNLPGFAAAQNLRERALSHLLAAGMGAIENLIIDDAYDWPSGDVESSHLEGLLSVIEAVPDVTPQTVLGEWSEYGWYESTIVNELTPAQDARPLATTTVRVTTGDGTPVGSATVEIDSDSSLDAAVEAAGSHTWLVTLRGAGAATLEVNHDEFKPATESLTVADAPKELTVELEAREFPGEIEYVPLRSQNRKNVLECFVTDQEHTPVVSAAVSVTNPDWTTVGITDEIGFVELEGVEPRAPIRLAVLHDSLGVVATRLRCPTDSAVAVRIHDESNQNQGNRREVGGN